MGLNPVPPIYQFWRHNHWWGVNISKEHAVNILTNILDFDKVCERWVPRLLTLDQMLYQKTISSENLKIGHKKLQKHFWDSLLTMDETWISHYTPENKLYSKPWIASDGLRSKKGKINFFS